MVMDLKDLQKIVVKFRDDREWEKYHNPKDVAMKLLTEVGECFEHLVWKDEPELKEYLKKNRQEVGYELADVLYNVILLANQLEVDLDKAFVEKMKINETKYPIEKSKGVNKKYNKL